MRKLLPLLLLAACGGSSNPCDGVTGTCTAFKAGATEAEIANAVSTAQPGTTFAFSAATYSFTNTLTIQAKNINVKGAGIDKTILDFSKLGGSTSGIGIDALDGSDGFAVQDFSLRDTFKNGIKVKGSTGVTFRRLKVSWTNPDASKHGDYALYPVFCKNVLVEDSDISGSSDAGIYVGQSQNIIVRNNNAHDNVAGIEIENSFSADVYGNTSTHNTGGVLVFDLPGSGNQHDGHDVRVFNNTISANNTANFNATGSTVGLVPAGTGTVVMSTRDVEVFGNQYLNNKTAAFAVISYFVISPTWDGSEDPSYYPISRRVWAHDNTFGNNGTAPDTQADLGLLLGSVMPHFTHSHIPEFIVDGIVDPSNPEPGAPTANFDQLNPDGSNLASVMTQDATDFNCQPTPLPAVSL